MSDRPPLVPLFPSTAENESSSVREGEKEASGSGLRLPGLDRDPAPTEKLRLNLRLSQDAYEYLQNYMRLASFDNASEALEAVLRWMAEIDPRLQLDPSDPALKPPRRSRRPPIAARRPGRSKRRSDDGEA